MAAKSRINHETHLAEVLDRRQKKFAEAEAEANAAVEKAGKAKKTKPAQDHIPPKLGAKEVLAMHKATMAIVLERRRMALSRKHPDFVIMHRQPEPAPDLEPKPKPHAEPAI